MARKKKEKPQEATASWLDTYADTITLLMTFFVLLYSMSTVDNQKVQQISKAFNEIMTGSAADSMLEYNLYDGEVPLVGGETKIDSEIKDSIVKETYEEIKDFVEENDLASTVAIIEDERGVILQLKDSILFETGKAQLKTESLSVLDTINVLIATMPNSVIVEGHTDNVPIKTAEFPSNWYLSSDRANSVVTYFIDSKKQIASRFSSMGYGEVKPLVQNTSDANRAQNRRVNILIVANSKE
ncbi:flagellar motor protein MotB [Clostridium vincentii]|uniref:Motility protein B n=1 Tax=Clostridium vincentii TaxID=52704 RepID=A0A2T0BJJ7_9CLOT|nr:flagellar motor protein MotB [Clostridium vincentii]PRR83972.1 Motility protein B [Clostridium vincentii]